MNFHRNMNGLWNVRAASLRERIEANCASVSVVS